MSGGNPVYWNKDMDIAIFSACSILDIKNYRAWSLATFDTVQYEKWKKVDDGGGNTSPGDKWKGIGPTYFLGYNWKSPEDETSWGMEWWGTWIAERFAKRLNEFPNDPVHAWERATDPNPLETSGAGKAGAAIKKPDNPSTDYSYFFWDQCTHPYDPNHPYYWYEIIQDGGTWPDKRKDFLCKGCQGCQDCQGYCLEEP